MSMRFIKIICAVILITCSTSNTWSQPNTLYYSSYLLCDSVITYDYHSCLDDYGNVYLAGTIEFGNLPVNGNSYDNTLDGLRDCFLMKLNPLNQIVWCTYFGGSMSEKVRDISVHNDSLFLAIISNSNDVTTANALYSQPNPDYPISQAAPLVSTWSLNGELLYASYLPVYINAFIGAGVDEIVFANGLYVVSSGSIQAVTYSSNPMQSTLNGQSDGYFAVFNKWGSLLYDTFIGSDEADEIIDISMDEQGLLIFGKMFGTSSLVYPPDYTPDPDKNYFVLNWNLVTNQIDWSYAFPGPLTSGTEGGIVRSTNSSHAFLVAYTLDAPSYQIYGNGGMQNTSPQTGYILELSESGTPIWSTYYPLLIGYITEFSLVNFEGNNLFLFPLNMESNAPLTSDHWDCILAPNQGSVLEIDANHNQVFGSYIGGNADLENFQAIASPSALYVFSTTTSTDLPITNLNSCASPAYLSAPFLYVFKHTTDVNEIVVEERGLIVYPNPFSSSLKITFESTSSPSHIQIFNLLGELVYAERINHLQNTEINTQNFPSGFFTIKATYENGDCEVVKAVRL